MIMVTETVALLNNSLFSASDITISVHTCKKYPILNEFHET